MKKMNVLLSAIILAVMTLTPVAAFANDADIQTGIETSQSDEVNPSGEENTPVEEDEFADVGENHFKKGSDSTKFSVYSKPSFTFYIPEGEKNIKDGSEFDISVKTRIDYKKSIVVTVSSKNGWKLKDKDHEKNIIDYHMCIGSQNGKQITNEDNVILEAPYFNEESSTKIVADGIGKPKFSGTYSDLLTFTAQEKDCTLPEPVTETSEPETQETETETTSEPVTETSEPSENKVDNNISDEEQGNGTD